MAIRTTMSICLVGTLLGAACDGRAATSLSDFCGLLRERGVTLDTNTVRRADMQWAARTIDPRARILSAKELAALGKGETLVRCESWSEGILYLKLGGLYDDGGASVANALKDWTAAGHCGLIMDMRGAGGTSLEAVDDVAAVFGMSERELYRIKDGRGQTVEVHRGAREKKPASGFPVVILVDAQTTGTSELLAAVMKARGGVMLIGSRTRGESGLPEAIPLADSSVLYVATRWPEPVDGQGYAQSGLMPDIQVDGAPVSTNAVFGREGLPFRTPSDKTRSDLELLKRVGADRALLRATDILMGLKALDLHAEDAPTKGPDRPAGK